MKEQNQKQANNGVILYKSLVSETNTLKLKDSLSE